MRKVPPGKAPPQQLLQDQREHRLKVFDDRPSLESQVFENEFEPVDGDLEDFEREEKSGDGLSPELGKLVRDGRQGEQERGVAGSSLVLREFNLKLM